MPSFTVDRNSGWNAAPWGRLCLCPNIMCRNFQIKFNGLETRIGHWQSVTGYRVTGPEMVFGVSAFTYPDEKFLGLSSDVAA
jgi:hypothetical protein